ncbi:MAG: Signal peptidase [Pseudomonadota bacterium]|jgi:signal peptidase I
MNDATTVEKSGNGNKDAQSGHDGATNSAPAKNDKAWSFENLRSLAFLFLLVFAIRWSIASPYHVPTPSMEPTIKVGDRLLAFKLAYNFKFPFTDWVVASWGTPKRGDIIVFKFPNDPDIDYVKRVVAVGGDEVAVIDGILFINGKPQSLTDHNNDREILKDIADDQSIKNLFRENLEGLDHWVLQNKPTAFRPISTFPASGTTHRVPEGFVFVIGDNRDSSSDSRIWGDVPLDYVRGKALFVIWSVFSPREGGWWKLRFDRFGHSLNG